MRVQGAWVNDDEIARVVTFVKEHSRPAFDDAFLSKLGKVRELGADDHEEDEDDADGGPTGAERSGEGEGVSEEDGDEVMVREAMRVIRDTRRASTSTLQRRLRIGFTRAGRIMDLLEERGIIGPPQGVAPRDILVDLDAGYVHTDGSSESPIKTEETDEGALETNADEPPDGSKDAGSGQK
jgi:S-DNA-T family DNA segregation ATPase FtsK/SpoIIIE